MVNLKMEKEKKQDLKDSLRVAKLDAEYHKKQMEYNLFQVKIYEDELKEFNKTKQQDNLEMVKIRYYCIKCKKKRNEQLKDK